MTKRFEDFYEAEFQRVYRTARLLVGGDAAYDVTQEAFTKAFVRWHRLGREEWAGGWVMTTTLNLARRALRKQPEIPNSDPLDGPNPDRVALGDALRLLPRRQQQAVVLTYLGDFSIHEVAEVMQISTGAVKAHLAQGRAALRRKLGGEDG